MARKTRRLILAGLAFAIYGALLVSGVVHQRSGLSDAVVGTIACLGAAFLHRTHRLRKTVALIVIFSTFMLFASGAIGLWFYASRSRSWWEAGVAMLLIAASALVWRSLELRLVTKPYDPPGSGPLAPA